ncbi:hypothetical protein DFH09DRAFT_1506386 [Mycena vulgaris]|nr:hypothetical protein DFH09DRAFT_1506386 [Mycena vulgaris]
MSINTARSVLCQGSGACSSPLLPSRVARRRTDYFKTSTTTTAVSPPVSPSKHTAHTRPTAATATARPTAAATAMPPIHRFRHTVRKVMAMHRGTNVLSRRGVGAEPGVDPLCASADTQFGGIKQDCYRDRRLLGYSQQLRLHDEPRICEFMNDPGASEREPWVNVRWINLGGISWDVIKAVSIKYDLHPLALKDVFHMRSQTRSKADYYTKHLFLRILCHELGLHPHRPPALRLADPFTDDDAEMEMRELGKGDLGEDEKTLAGTANSSRRKRRPLLPTTRSNLNAWSGPRSRLTELATVRGDAAEVSNKHRIEEASIQALKSGERVNVKVPPMYIFLLRNGTVISMHATPDLELTQPITLRLRQRDTGLRMSADLSLLVQSLLDLLVDKALEVRAIPFPSHPLLTVLKMLALSTGLSGIAPRGGCHCDEHGAAR